MEGYRIQLDINNFVWSRDQLLCIHLRVRVFTSAPLRAYVCIRV